MHMDAAALLAHIVSQTEQNIKFLIAQNQISDTDGRDILQKLSQATSNTHDTRAATSIESPFIQETQNLTISSPLAAPVATFTPSTVITPHAYQPPPATPTPRVLFRAKAIWDYNANNQDPNDLAFHAGDTIDILTETNADWWTGSLHGKQGLFPSNYVEKIPGSVSVSPLLPPPQMPTQYTSPPPMQYGSMEKVSTSYAPSYGGYQPPGGYQGPPPPGGYQPYANTPPPAQQQQQVEQPASAPPQDEPKKSKFGGKLGSTLAHSAVGGVGFGAGSAVGHGIINSIF